MWVESEGVRGKGSTFFFSIRAMPAWRPAGRAPSDYRELFRGKRLLIVDDNETNRRILSVQAERWGFAHMETEEPEKALAAVREGERFDLALLDMHMPGMDGLALAGAIREWEREQSIAEPLMLVLLSSLSIHDVKARDNLFAASMTKPLKLLQLRGLLFDLLADRQILMQPPAASSLFDGALAKRLPLRILVAEDNPVNLRLALRLLERMGYRADVACNGLEVVQAVDRQPYDVILMDVAMPEMDGLEATRVIRERSRFAQPRIIAVTAHAMREDREICLNAGMDDYLAKPIDVEQLQGALERTAREKPVGSAAKDTRSAPNETPELQR